MEQVVFLFCVIFLFVIVVFLFCFFSKLRPVVKCAVLMCSLQCILYTHVTATPNRNIPLIPECPMECSGSYSMPHFWALGDLSFSDCSALNLQGSDALVLCSLKCLNTSTGFPSALLSCLPS